MSDIRRPGTDAMDPRTMVLAVYSLCLAGFVTFGVTILIGMILALAARASAPEWARSHFEFQLRSVVGLAAGGLIGALLTRAMGLGIFLLVILAIWFAVRMVLGLNRAQRGESHPNPKTWLT